MTIRALVAVAVFSLCQFAQAQTCPTVNDIKTKTLVGWKAYDSDDNQLLSEARTTKFKKGVEEFALAEWLQKDSKHGSVHCYYRDKSGSDLEAYFSNDNLIPLKQHSYWYSVTGFMHCAAGMEQCQFKQVNSTSQLAKTNNGKHVTLNTKAVTTTTVTNKTTS